MTLVNEEWLKSLKEGDLVAIDIGQYGSVYYITSLVKKVTPTRMIKTSCGRTYNNDGWERGKSSTWSQSTYLQPVTDEIEEIIDRRNLINFIKGIDLEKLSTADLRGIASIIE